MKTYSFEFIVGLIAIFVAGWFLINVLLKSDEISNFGEVTKYSASFDDVSGISVGSDIKLAGVTIGRVKKLKLDTLSYTAEMVLEISSKIKLPSDSEIVITSESLLGGSYVSISPGGSDTFMQENEKFSYTQSSLSLNSLLQKFFSR
tara:strand:+ start:1477 stop:1917 length:441 start_codon:yes stop_codon:yes gene_type:complete